MTYGHPALGTGALAPERLAEANINPETGLATDYLNHFNEVVMLLEMLPDMPDCVEDVLAWRPLDYVSHFEQSHFSEKQLAVLAYRAAPAALRGRLAAVVARIDAAVGDAQARLVNAEDLPAVSAEVAGKGVSVIRPLVAEAGAIIHGHVDHLDGDETKSQAAIDLLFA